MSQVDLEIQYTCKTKWKKLAQILVIFVIAVLILVTTWSIMFNNNNSVLCYDDV